MDPKLNTIRPHLALETELEEKVLRYRLTLKDRLYFEWRWQVERSRGGMECTILAHISSGTNALSIQNKRHLYWKALESIPGMNEIEFSASAHNLLLKISSKLKPPGSQESNHKHLSLASSDQKEAVH
jgi:hypothetical protein